MTDPLRTVKDSHLTFFAPIIGVEIPGCGRGIVAVFNGTELEIGVLIAAVKVDSNFVAGGGVNDFHNNQLVIGLVSTSLYDCLRIAPNDRMICIRAIRIGNLTVNRGMSQLLLKLTLAS